MTSFTVFLISLLAWIVWIPAASLQKTALGNSGGVSIFPAIPVFPLLSWALAYGLNMLYPRLGLFLVGGGHVIFLAALLVSIVRSAVRIRRAPKQHE